MTAENIFYEMGCIDDDLIAYAAGDVKPKKRNSWIKWTAMAACVCVAAAAAVNAPVIIGKCRSAIEKASQVIK